MTVQYSAAVKNAKLDAWETAIGTSAILKLRTGSMPALITDASSGTVVSTINLPSDWMAAASGGVKAKSGTWQDTSADTGGTIGHYEITASDGTTVHERGTYTLTAGGGDMTGDATVVTAGQTITITAFSKTSGN
jgi:hypothetical protein